MYFLDPALWSVAPLPFSLVQLSPPFPPPCVNKCTLYTYIVCIQGGYGVLGLRQINTCRKVPLQGNYLRRRHFALPSMSLIFLWVNVMVQKDSDLSAGPPRAVNMKMESAERITCPDTWQGPARGKSPQTISTNGLPVEIASGVSADCRKDYSIF